MAQPEKWIKLTRGNIRLVFMHAGQQPWDDGKITELYQCIASSTGSNPIKSIIHEGCILLDPKDVTMPTKKKQ